MKLNKIIFIVILSLTIYSPFVFADGKAVPSTEEIEQVKADLAAQVEASDKETYAPAWEENFNDLHIQSAALLEENARLSRENVLLQDELMRLEKEVQEQESKNKSLLQEMDEKKAFSSGKTQKKNAEVLKEEQSKLNEKQEELAEYNRKIDLLEKKIALGRIRLKSLDIDGDTEKILGMEEELMRGRAELDQNNNRVAVVKEQVKSLSANEKNLDPAVLNLQVEIDAVRSDIATLEQQAQANAVENIVPEVPGDEENISTLTQKKESLQADLQGIQEKMAQFKNSEHMGVANLRIKKLVASISEIDVQNEQWREEIKYLQENILILKMRVKKLEYQADAINSMKGKMTPTQYLQTKF